MKMILLLAVCVGAAVAAPNAGYGAVPSYAAVEKELPPGKHVPIESMSLDSDHKGAYNLAFKSGDGHQVEVSGSLKDLGDKEGPVTVKRGSYSYTGPDNKVYTVNWTADENGFHATGDHLPTPPPIPEDINRSIDRSSLPADHHLVLESTRARAREQLEHRQFAQFGGGY